MGVWILLRVLDISPGGFVPSSDPGGRESGGGVRPLAASAAPAPPTEGG
jgi:hypothetical protein